MHGTVNDLSCYITTYLQNGGQEEEAVGQGSLTTTIFVNLLLLNIQAGNLNIKRSLLIKENQISHIKGFATLFFFTTLLCKGRCKYLGLLKSFLSYTSQLSVDQILIIHILNSSFTVRGGRYGRWLTLTLSCIPLSSSVLTREEVADDCWRASIIFPGLRNLHLED